MKAVTVANGGPLKWFWSQERTLSAYAETLLNYHIVYKVGGRIIETPTVPFHYRNDVLKTLTE